MKAGGRVAAATFLTAAFLLQGCGSKTPAHDGASPLATSKPDDRAAALKRRGARHRADLRLVVEGMMANANVPTDVVVRYATEHGVPLPNGARLKRRREWEEKNASRRPFGGGREFQQGL